MDYPKSLFVGNIPYDYDEESLKETLSLVGPVKFFEIKSDEKTKKPKGYGFCEYVNAEIAASALRNLENQDYKGRQLRINLQAIDKNKPLKPNEDLWKAKNDIIYVKNNQSGDENLINSLRGLTEEQKLLLLYSINVLSMKRGNDGNSDFDKLLKNQSDEVLDAIIDLQNSVIDEYKTKNYI